MLHTFVIKPITYNAFEDEAEQIEKCRDWGLLSGKATKTKAFFYKGNGMNLSCSIVGYVDKMTAVIQFENEQQHCIHPSYLKEMQASNYGQKVSLVTEEAAEPERTELESTELLIMENEAPPFDVDPIEEAPIAAIAADQTEEPAAQEPPKGKAKKEKAPKLQLPEDKVKMTATVIEFTTVPNNFSDNDDEVVIYDSVSIIEPAISVGVAWSSHSATLKKLELEIGDTLSFEGKIVTKKLTKHPVPYKINNPAKIQKEKS
ncbi:hypothetical protein FHS15_004026 [Paenibacillus castaneae]|uniref:hypothetical protein n=1 Tax=Paenibacillus castaneae TaxID=474957 RepID=UPI000C99EBCD|nr:hypothetical protein [Paenibacillus castaneae]NIK78880.1 hypothetical protein [Paenibacillus castaneae]